jgi:hypothetical protein
MRKSLRAVVLVFLAFLTTIGLTVAAALTAAITLAATTALIVPGTGTPNANIVTDYLRHAADRYIAPFNPSCTSTNCQPQGINYPASFWPLFFIGNWCPGLSCDTWNDSVGTGVANLNTALTNATSPVVVFGYSQGGAVVSTELNNIRNDPALLAKISSVVTIGGIENPDGGLWARLSFIPYVPILDITPHPAMPVDVLPGKIVTIGFQYDPVVYSPLYWGNPIALLNAVAAFETVHGFYLTPNGNGPTDPIAYGYSTTELANQMNCATHKANCRTDQFGNTYIMIPAKSLPLTDFVMSIVPSALTPIVKPFADLATPVLKVLADLGYDWSGNPSVVTPLSILPFNPFQNWLAVGANLAVAGVQGVQAFLGDLGGLTTPIAPTTPAPAPTMSLIAARSGPMVTPALADPPKTQTLTDQVSNPKTTTVTQTTDVVQKTVVQKTDVTPIGDTTPSTATQTKPSTTNEPPVTKPADTTKPEEPKPSDSTTNTGKKADTGKKDPSKKDTDKKATDKKDTDKKPGTGKTKDAEPAKAAA